MAVERLEEGVDDVEGEGMLRGRKKEGRSRRRKRSKKKEEDIPLIAIGAKAN
jgi:hypothetical protein